MVNAGKVVSKSQILDRVWNYDFGGDSRIVESYISYLRRKIDQKYPPLIHTIRGVGYTLRLPYEALDTGAS
jgi:two-component system OmpR family response regulator